MTGTATTHTTTAATALADQLSSSVPKLDSSGKNWAIFLIHFQDAVEAKGFWGHFDGTEPCPQPDVKDQATADENPAVKQWRRDEMSAKSLLSQKLPDSTLLRIRMKKSVKERWDEVVTEFTEKGTYAQTELRAKFLDSRCTEKGNVHEFLEGLRTKRKELATMGVDIKERDY